MVDFEHKKAADKLDFFLDLSIVVGFVGICKGWDSPQKFFFDWTNTSYLGYQEFLLETYCQDMNFGLSSPHYSLTPCLILPRQCFHLFTACQYHFQFTSCPFIILSLANRVWLSIFNRSIFCVLILNVHTCQFNLYIDAPWWESFSLLEMEICHCCLLKHKMECYKNGRVVRWLK